MADQRGCLFPYKKKGEVHRWHVRFPGQGVKDYVASVSKEEHALAKELLTHLRCQAGEQSQSNADLRKVCQDQLTLLRRASTAQSAACALRPEEEDPEVAEPVDAPTPAAAAGRGGEADPDVLPLLATVSADDGVPPQISIECEICWEPFNECSRAPFLSKCGHTFCQSCMKKILGSSQTYDCPKCRKTFTADQCMKNVWIIQNLDALRRRRATSRPKEEEAASAVPVQAQALGEVLGTSEPRRAKRRRVNEPGFADPSSEREAPARPRPLAPAGTSRAPNPGPLSLNRPRPPADPRRAAGPRAGQGGAQASEAGRSRSSRPMALSYGASLRRLGPRTSLPARESKISVAVPDSLMGRVIGPGGSVIQAAQRTFGVKVSCEAARVDISGQMAAVESCAQALHAYVKRNSETTDEIQVPKAVAGAFWPADLRAVEREACAEVPTEQEVFLEKRQTLRVDLDKDSDVARFRVMGTGAAVQLGLAKLKERVDAIKVREIEVPVNEQVVDVNELVSMIRSMSGKRGISIDPSPEVAFLGSDEVFDLIRSGTDCTRKASIAMAMAMAAEEDTAAVAHILMDCFGHGGDFTVLVEEHVEGEAGSEVKQTEFKVWSPLLTRWSPVFDRMIHSQGFMEGHQARVVINDFSSMAVEAFLHFLYSGVVEGSLVDLVAEVAALADKYQVTRLQELCMQAFQKGLGPENACQVLASAVHFQLPDLRRQALEMIWINAKVALTSCPSISPGLLEEILQPGLLCISNSELEVMMNDWCSRDSWKKRQADEEMALLETVIQRQRTRIEREREDLVTYHGQPFESDTIYSADIFRSLWTVSPPGAPFLGLQIDVVLGHENSNSQMTDAVALAPSEDHAANVRPVRTGGGSFAWKLVHYSIYLTGLSFERDLPEQDLCQVYCSQDRSSWHLAADASKSKIEANKRLRLNRPPGIVKWFKLEVEGDLYNCLRNLRLRGIIKDDLH
ncbi:mel-26 [Symbiodinium sp. CCMP2592]|nr:mel-26 [Symbiodinium sp. CCMP2592]